MLNSILVAVNGTLTRQVAASAYAPLPTSQLVMGDREGFAQQMKVLPKFLTVMSDTCLVIGVFVVSGALMQCPASLEPTWGVRCMIRPSQNAPSVKGLGI